MKPGNPEGGGREGGKEGREGGGKEGHGGGTDRMGGTDGGRVGYGWELYIYREGVM